MLRRLPLFALAATALLAIACGSSTGSSRPTPAPTVLPRTAVPSPAASGSGGPTPVTSSKQWPNPPAMTIDPSKQYFATIKTTRGDVTVELFASEVPQTVNNFVFLAREGFYDGVKFHRIMKNFMIQTGDPQGTGAGGPGYRFADERVTREYDPGIVAMANAGPNTNGSQFFIVQGERRATLPKNYTIFGKVTEGMSVVDQIANTPVRSSPQGEPSVPTEDVRILSVSIEEK